MKQEEIKARQNEIHMLKIQFSAKGYYNAAEKIGNLSWFCCVLSALTFLIPDSAGVACLLLAPIICDILAFFFSVSQNSLVLKAASFRRYFDAYVLDIDNNYSKHEIEKFRGDAEEYCLKHKRACDIQIANTGSDKPPGVRDWYDLSKEYSDQDVQFECQKQNAWWDERLSKAKVVLLISITVLFTIACIVLIKVYPKPLTIISCLLSSALIVKGIERAREEIKYRKLSIRIDGAITVMNTEITAKHICELQKLINNRRQCNVVGINFLHRIKAKSLSQLYIARKQ